MAIESVNLTSIDASPVEYIDPDILVKNCTRAALEEFPKFDFLILPWSLLVPPLVIIYAVLLLVKICDRHFIPSIKIICYGLGLGSDVAGATLMAAGVSSPDLFINLVGTFLTEGDIGIGTVLGCGVINTLLVPGICVLVSTSKGIKLRYWAVTRDCFFYFLTISVLVISLYDGRISIGESASMVSLYMVYILVMSKNTWFRIGFETCWKKIRRRTTSKRESLPLLMKHVASAPYGLSDHDDLEAESICTTLFTLPEDLTLLGKIMYFIGWPLDLVLYLTMPSFWNRCTSLANGITFSVCLVWIAVVSYVVAWMITVMGFELGVPDSLMGLTFLAIGMSVPESLTSIIVAKQGHGSMAIGNVLGSSIFDILVCLGIPWLIKAAIFSPDGWVEINSRGLSLSTGLQLAFLAIFYVSLAYNKFHLTLNIGIMSMVLYCIFAVLSTLTEMNVFFIGNLPSCLLST